MREDPAAAPSQPVALPSDKPIIRNACVVMSYVILRELYVWRPARARPTLASINQSYSLSKRGKPMRIHRLIMVGALLGALVTPGTASAWLVCDPCCKGTQSEQEETITGYRAATFYANAGIHYFQGLLALEHSDYTNANTNFEQFYVAANELRIVLDGADSTLTQSIEEVIEYGEAMSILQGRELPDIETITELGKKWAQLQTIANDAVLRSCQSR